MMKKILALILVAVTVLSLSALVTSADDGRTVSQRAAMLKSLDVMKGDPDGNLRLDDNITRAEFTKMAVAMSSARNSISTSLNVSPFKDVPYTHWSAPYVRLAVSEGYIRGYSDFTFRPDNNVTYAEATTVALKLLGYTDADFGAAWPHGQMSTAKSISLTDGIEGDYNSPISRGGCVILLTNLLDTKLKNSQSKYASVIDCELRESVILVATKNEDPSVASGKIYTTAGTFKIGDDSVTSNIGARGDVLIRNGDEIISFTPTGSATTSKMVVYSTIGNVVIGYVNGQLTQETVSSGTTAYVGASPSTFASASGRLSMGSVMTIQKDLSGNIEYVSISEGATLKGPVIVTNGGWYTAYTSNIDEYAVIRNGSKATAQELKVNDVAYFSPDLKILFAYANTRTGIYESASPNKDMPTTVRVSGVNYEIEGAAAFNALSSTGTLEFGDTVTLLLGKDGKIAGVAGAGTGTVSDVCGYLVGSGKKNFTDEKGSQYSSYYIEVVLPGGEKAEYTTKANYEKYLNNIVKVNFSTSGTSIAAITPNASVYGKVDAANYKIGNFSVDKDVKILEVNTSSQGVTPIYKNVLLKRLDGVKLGDNNVLYASKNSNGKYDKIIIEDVTGDLYSYGMITSADKEAGMYTFDVNGSTYTATGSFTAVSKYTPAKFGIAGGKTVSMMSISEINEKIESLSATELVTEKGTTYILSDSVSVYVTRAGSLAFKWVPISEILENPENYSINAFYDKKSSDGGRVRVIVANQK